MDENINIDNEELVISDPAVLALDLIDPRTKSIYINQVIEECLKSMDRSKLNEPSNRTPHGNSLFTIFHSNLVNKIIKEHNNE